MGEERALRNRERGTRNEDLGTMSGGAARLLRRVGLTRAGLLAMTALLVFGAACSGTADGNSGGELPDFAYNSAITLAGYKAAVRTRDSLYAIPCYCGCGESQGHTSLKDCFFKDDGSFNDHASNCHICADESVDVGKWLDEGLPVKEVRSRIEAKYTEFGPGTNTPPIQ